MRGQRWALVVVVSAVGLGATTTPAIAEPVAPFAADPSGEAPCPEGASRTATIEREGFESGIPEPGFANGWLSIGTSAPEGTRAASSSVSGAADDPEDYFFLTPRRASGATYLAFASRGSFRSGHGIMAVNSFRLSVPPSSGWSGRVADITSAVDDEDGWLTPWFSHTRTTGIPARWDVDNIQLFTCAPNATSRVEGSDRYAVSAAIADTFAPGTRTAYVARGDNFPDALTGVPVAAKGHAPILLVHPDEIPATVDRALNRLRPKQIVILGGPASVSPALQARLSAYTPGPVTRITGPDRYAVAAALSKGAFPDGSREVFVASGEVFPDALSAAPLAAGATKTAPASPLLLTRGDELPAVVATEVRRLAPRTITVVGGPRTVSEAVLDALRATGASVTRVSGDDRYDVSAEVAARFGTGALTGSYLASGEVFPDAILGAALAGARHEPLLLTSGRRLPAVIADGLERLQEVRGTVVGGPASVAAIVRDEYGRTLP
ncbi:MAG: cell wall-binding repeat-containing protein [Actinobacteria bacterium]|nr:cell wall-binding repeat-containing protein [Actinomycetota bacterium]